MDLSRVEDILKYFLGEAETLPHPLSRVEELLIALGHLIEEGTVSNPISIRGRVSSVSELPVDATPGWMYFVGSSGAEEYSEYIYLDGGRWEYLGTSMIDIDTALSPSSTNPVQNQAVTAAINQINQTLGDKVDKVQGKGLSTEDYTTAEKTKLSGIESGAEVNVQPDWNQNDNTSDDFIKNKPTIPAAVTVDQTYDATSANPQSGVAISGVIGDINTVLEGVL